MNVRDEDKLITDTIKVVDWDRTEPYTTGWRPQHLGLMTNGRKPFKTLCGVRMSGKVLVRDEITDGLCSRCLRSAERRANDEARELGIEAAEKQDKWSDSYSSCDAEVED